MILMTNNSTFAILAFVKKYVADMCDVITLFFLQLGDISPIISSGGKLPCQQSVISTESLL